jgi:hypothetical protein
MKMKKIGLIVAVLALSLTSCDDFLADNQTPNTVLDEQIPPRLMLPGAQTQTFRTQAITMNNLGTIMTNAWAGNIYQYTNPFSLEYSYNFDNNSYSGIWDGLYRNVYAFQRIIETPEANQGNYIAIAKIMKAHYMQYIVDLYGDAPYFEAFKGQTNVTPAYTDDAVIYKELIKELEEARAFIQNPAAGAVAASTDVMLGGDMTKWEQFANTIELRILLRQSELTDAATVAYVASKYADLQASNNFVSANVLINPGYSASNDDQQNPFYFANIRNAAGSTANTRYTLYTASKFFAGVLNGTAGGPTDGVVDGRRGRFFTLAGTPQRVVGVDQGETAAPGTNNTTNPTSRIGVGISGHVATSTMTAVQAGSAKSGVVMLLSESLFLQAEAVQRGYLTGDAHALFDQGVQASFTYLGATIGGYLGAIDTKAGFGWTATTDKVEAILTQKWIALSEIHGAENYINYTRTGYPVIPGSINGVNLHASRPKRLIYPISEYNTNSAHVPNLLSADIITQGPFWYVP